MLPANKTKIVCTIGPASETLEVQEELLRAGMNIARLNFSHGDFAWHKRAIESLREASRNTGHALTIMADLPGPKIRLGAFGEEPVRLEQGDVFTLTTDDILGNAERASVSFERLPEVVHPGDVLFLNDGTVQLLVEEVEGANVRCRSQGKGELMSHKGLNLPGINLGISAFTSRDAECLGFAMANGVDAVSQSFVVSAADVKAVRIEAERLGHRPFIIAKIERAGALSSIEEILEAADGIMVARGDLGVETPIERIALVQKELTRTAKRFGKPVITATQMLASMVNHHRPTRAEATDVANAILDGTDCVMLSEESAMGRFPVEAAGTLARIAVATEPYRSRRVEGTWRDQEVPLVDAISRNVEHTVADLGAVAVVVPTVTGHTARMVSRFMLPVWIAAVSPEESTCQNLQFSYGVQCTHQREHPDCWKPFAQSLVKDQGLERGLVVLTEGPSKDNPDANHRVEIIDLRV